MSIPRESITNPEVTSIPREVVTKPEIQQELKAPASPAIPATDAPPHRVTRQNRKPFGSVDQKLSWPVRTGYHNHWFNDEPGRIYQAKEAGYDHVNDHRGVPVSRVVGVKSSGEPLLGYLMEIPQEWWEEDMAAQQRLVDEKMSAIKRGHIEKHDAKDTYAFYAGSDRGQIDIRDSHKRDIR